MKKYHLHILFICLTIALSACTKKTFKKESYFFPLLKDSEGNYVLPLNTNTRLITVDKTKQDAMRKEANAILKNYHQLTDSHHSYKNINNLKTINDNYGKGKIKIDSLLIEMLELSFTYAKLSEGYFNPTIGNISSKWQNKLKPYPTYQSDPSKNDLEKGQGCLIKPSELSNYIVLDKENKTVEFKKYPSCKEKVSLDLGAFSKGYIIDKMYHSLLKYDSSFLIDAGTSSLITYNAKKENIDWHIGIRNPRKEEMLLAFKANNLAISTSGDYEKFYFKKEEPTTRRHHILNPLSSYPENYYCGLTLIAQNNAGLLDALSTALFNIEDKDTIKKINSNFVKKSNLKIDRLFIKEKNSALDLLMDKDFNKHLSEEDIKKLNNISYLN